jgi:hypothetical protein
VPNASAPQLLAQKLKVRGLKPNADPYMHTMLPFLAAVADLAAKQVRVHTGEHDIVFLTPPDFTRPVLDHIYFDPQAKCHRHIQVEATAEEDGIHCKETRYVVSEHVIHSRRDTLGVDDILVGTAQEAVEWYIDKLSGCVASAPLLDLENDIAV